MLKNPRRLYEINLEIRKSLQMFLFGGAGAIAVGFLGGIGTDAWTWLKSGFDSSQNWSFWSEQTLSYVAVGIGIGSIIIGLLKLRKEETTEKEKESDDAPTESADEKLDLNDLAEFLSK